MSFLKTLSFLLLSHFLVNSTVVAQVSISTLGAGGAYTQNFDALGTADFALTNNTSITGVYAFRSLANSTPNIFFADNGSGSSNEFKNYGSTGSADRALGSLAGPGTETMQYGLRFSNDTGVAITRLEVTYVGEQWRDAASVLPQMLMFEYRVSSMAITDLNSGTYIAFPTLDFVTPTNSGVGAIDGNAPGNRTQLSATISVTIPAGHEIMLRWTDLDEVVADHGISIDDFVLIARAGTTAANAGIRGRVVTGNGRGIPNTRVQLTGGELSFARHTLTNAFGYYSFDGIEAGRNYILTVSSKRYRFANPTIFVDLSDSAFDVNFVAEP